MESRRRVDDRCLEVIGILEGYRDPDAAPFREPVGGRQQTEDQLHRLPGLDEGQVALIMGGEGQPEIVIRCPAQFAVRSPESPLGDDFRVND